MSDQAAEALPLQARAFPWRTAMPWLVAAGLYALLLVMAERLLADADLYWHIRV